MSISNIERRSSWYDIYNESGKKTKTLSSSIGDIEGFGSDFFVVSRSSWYDLYDENGKKYKTLSNTIGSIVSVLSNGFLIKRSS